MRTDKGARGRLKQLGNHVRSEGVSYSAWWFAHVLHIFPSFKKSQKSDFMQNLPILNCFNFVLTLHKAHQQAACSLGAATCPLAFRAAVSKNHTVFCLSKGPGEFWVWKPEGQSTLQTTAPSGPLIWIINFCFLAASPQRLPTSLVFRKQLSAPLRQRRQAWGILGVLRESHSEVQHGGLCSKGARGCLGGAIRESARLIRDMTLFGFAALSGRRLWIPQDALK